MVDAGNVIEVSLHPPVEWRWVESATRDVRIGYLGEPDENFCQCLVDYARLHVTVHMHTGRASDEELTHIAQAVGYAVGASRRGLIEVLSAERPGWLPLPTPEAAL
jgi:hypothetical protein